MNNIPLNIVTLPLWWYSNGLKITFDWAQRSINFTIKRSALKIFIKHMGSSLYGYSSRQDRILGIALRVVLLLIKIFAIIFKVLAVCVGMLLYLTLIPLVLGLLIYYIIPF